MDHKLELLRHAIGRAGGTRTLKAAFIVTAVLVMLPAVVYGFNSIGNTWSTIYPASLSRTNAGCLLCHGAVGGSVDTSTWNPYGWAIRQGGSDAAAITAAAGANSDGDPGGASNLAEISANSQPGWTLGSNNTIYDPDGNVTTGVPVPAGITGLIDQAAAAPNIAVSPATLAFGTVTVGASSALNVTVQNTGTATLTVSGITITGTSEFTFARTTPFDVAAGGSTTIPVTYAPTAAGADSATLAIASNDPDTASASVALTGTGQAAAAPNIAVSPATLAFGTVTVGASSALNVTVQNTGTATLTVSGITITGTSEFTFARTTPFDVAAGGSTTIPVTYAPTAAGADSATLAIASNDPDTASASVALTGTGQAAAAPNIAVSPATLAFGTVTVGASSALNVTVQNTGTATLTVSGITITGTSEFTFARTTPFDVAAGGSTTIPVTYAPTAAGADSATLAIASNDPDTASASVALTGTGQAATAPNIDLDIKSFRASHHVRLSHFRDINLTLVIANRGDVPATGTATITGTQGGVVVFTTTLVVTDGVGGGQTKYAVDIFDPSPFGPGEVTWSVTLDVPGDRDGAGGDVATATTTITP